MEMACGADLAPIVGRMYCMEEIAAYSEKFVPLSLLFETAKKWLITPFH